MTTLRLNPNNEKDKMCLSKKRYESLEDIKKNAKKTDHPLYAYECPYCEGYHLTKHQRPINNRFQDRVNIVIE